GQELSGHPLAGTELRAVLQVEVQVRLAAPARVAALADHVSSGDSLTRFHPQGALAQVRQERVLAGAVVYDHVVAERPLVVEDAGRVVGHVSQRGHHDAVARSEYRL